MTNEHAEPWIYEETQLDELPQDKGLVGFIYVITNLLDGRKYYGKKKCFFKRTALKTVTLKSGIKKKKKVSVIKESDWRTYYGSSDELNTDVDTLGVENFTREILRWCYSLSELSYYEIKYQIENDVLLHQDRFYNRWITCKITSMHMKKTADAMVK